MANDPNFQRQPGRRSIVRTARILLPLAALALTGCEQRFGLPESGTEQGDDVTKLWQTSFYGAAALGGLVFALLLYTVIRHRRRNNDLPKQTEGSVPLELFYTAIPFIVVVLLFAYGVKVQASSTKLTDDPDVRVDITGYQWNWRFAYPNDPATPADDVTIVGNNLTLPELMLPVDQKVRFNLVAADVAHSFFVPNFLTKRDVIPGVRNEIELTPSKTGFYIGHCAEYCGLNHAQMNFRVRVVPQTEYDQWMRQRQAAPAPPAPPPIPSGPLTPGEPGTTPPPPPIPGAQGTGPPPIKRSAPA